MPCRASSNRPPSERLSNAFGERPTARSPHPWNVPDEGPNCAHPCLRGPDACLPGGGGLYLRAKKDTAETAQPFTGASITRPLNPDPTAAPPEVDSLLAGEIIDRSFNKRVPNASIQLVDLQDANPSPAAKLDVTANPDGYFFIPGLQRGHHYQLIARIKEGDHILSGTTLAMPPNPRLSIYLSEDFTSPSTPAPLGPPTVPGKAPPADKDAGKTSAAPSASIDPPMPGRTDGGFNPAPLRATRAPPVDRTKIAEGNGASESGGFQKYAPPTAAIPGGPPPPAIPPPPPFFTPPPPAAPSLGTPSQEQAGPAPNHVGPPFCVLVGNHLDDLALPSVDGQTWEFRRDPPRKLVLLDFWKTTCPPCQAAIKHLRSYQDRYGPDGLEVVGIAYEDPGRPEDQLARLRNAAPGVPHQLHDPARRRFAGGAVSGAQPVPRGQLPAARVDRRQRRYRVAQRPRRHERSALPRTGAGDRPGLHPPSR